jgi:hypothetical protein
MGWSDTPTIWGRGPGPINTMGFRCAQTP